MIGGDGTFHEVINGLLNRGDHQKIPIGIIPAGSGNSFMNDLDADSLDLVELIMAFEEEFSTDDNPVEISDEDAEGILTVQDALNFLNKKGIS